MKTIGELGISPTPWTNTIDNVNLNQVWDVANKEILSGGYPESISDARLIAAAPELYEALYNAIQTTCDGCDYENCEEECKDCPRHWWRKVLAKAAGEEEANNGL